LEPHVVVQVFFNPVLMPGVAVSSSSRLHRSLWRAKRGRHFLAMSFFSVAACSGATHDLIPGSEVSMHIFFERGQNEMQSGAHVRGTIAI
jgi:hypothetical protein